MTEERISAVITQVGLTGGAGCGKSTAAAYLRSRGAHVIDLDALSRDVLQSDQAAIREVIHHFDSRIVAKGLEDGQPVIDRAALAAIVFSNAAERAFLEEVVLSRVSREVHRLVDAIRQQNLSDRDVIVVHDSPLLVERGHAADFDLVVVVTCPLETRLERLSLRGWSKERSMAVIAAQASDEERASVADLVVSNAGSEGDFQRALSQVWDEILRRISAVQMHASNKSETKGLS